MSERNFTDLRALVEKWRDMVPAIGNAEICASELAGFIGGLDDGVPSSDLIREFVFSAVGQSAPWDRGSVDRIPWGHEFITALTIRLSQEANAGWQLAHDRAQCGHPRACYQDPKWPESSSVAKCIMCDLVDKLEAEQDALREPFNLKTNAVTAAGNQEAEDSAEAVEAPSKFYSLEKATEIYEAHTVAVEPTTYPGDTTCKCGANFKVASFEALQMCFVLHMIQKALEASK